MKFFKRLCWTIYAFAIGLLFAPLLPFVYAIDTWRVKGGDR